MEISYNNLKKLLIILIIFLMDFFSVANVPSKTIEKSKASYWGTTATVEIREQEGAKTLPPRTETTSTIPTTQTTLTTLPHFKRR